MNSRAILQIFVAMILALSISGLVIEARGQKRGKGVNSTTNNPTETTGPKRGKGVVEKEEAPKVVTRTEILKVEVKPNKGYLSIVAVPEAQVTLTPTSATPARKGAKPSAEGKPVLIKEQIKGEDGTLNLADMKPGEYKVAVEHADYHPYSETIKVSQGQLTTVNASAKLVSRYGQIVIGGAPKDSIVLLDDSRPDPANIKVDEQGTIVISRVPVGEHKLKISKARHDDWSVDKLEVKPGDPTPVTAILPLSTVTLVVRSKPDAKVYLNDEERGTVQPDGAVTISKLLPGDYKIRVFLDGYESWEKTLTLSLENRIATENVALAPIPVSAEGDWNPHEGAKKWSPAPAWKFDRTGARITGDSLALFDTEQRRDFNIYRDFKLEFDVRFANAKGAAWVVRAKDPKNYYLFELNGGPQSSNPRTFNFYVYHDGKPVLKDSKRIVENIDKLNDSFHITFEARGNQFKTYIQIASDPKGEAQPIGTFTDDSFSYGGVGFRAKDGIETLLQSFVVMPIK